MAASWPDSGIPSVQRILETPAFSSSNPSLGGGPVAGNHRGPTSSVVSTGGVFTSPRIASG